MIIKENRRLANRYWLITHDQLNEALNTKTNGGKIGNILIENNYVTESQVMEVLEFQLVYPLSILIQ